VLVSPQPSELRTPEKAAKGRADPNLASVLKVRTTTIHVAVFSCVICVLVLMGAGKNEETNDKARMKANKSARTCVISCGGARHQTHHHRLVSLVDKPIPGSHACHGHTPATPIVGLPKSGDIEVSFH